MTKLQFEALATLLDLADADRRSAFQALFEGASPSTDTRILLERLQSVDAMVRGAYVVHGPMEFRIEVGHRDAHRAPGALQLAVGDVIRLTARSSERWVPVKVTALPCRPIDYYQGVVHEQIVSGSRFAVGDGVEFSEDQVVLDAMSRVKGIRRRRL